MNDRARDRFGSGGNDRSDTVRILHVDSPEFVEITSDFLRRNFDDIEVETRTDPADAAAFLRKERFSCVVSDYDIPGVEMDGVDLHSEVRSISPDLPFVFLTDTPFEDIPAEALSDGSTTYLRKKLDPEQFTELFEHAKELADPDAYR